MERYEQNTSGTSQRQNYISSMGHKFAVMTELQSQSLSFYMINVSYHRSQCTCVLSAVKTVLQSYCDTSYSRGDVNQMWILKNSKDMLEYIKSRSLSSCCSIKTFDFSILYTIIPHSKLKDRLRELVQLCFMTKNSQRRYKYLVLGRDSFYLVKKTTLIL